MPRRDDDADTDSELQELEARETLAADEVPEVVQPTATTTWIALEAHASEDIVGDVDGDDYAQVPSTRKAAIADRAAT